MKSLLLLISIFFVAVTTAIAQKKDDVKLPVGTATSIVTLGSSKEPLDESKLPQPGVYPTVPDSIMRAQLVKLDGTIFTLEEYRGKAVLLHLYATWSGPDRAEVPRLIELQEKYGDSGLTIIALNAGNGNGKPEDRKTIEKFAKRMKTNYDLVQEVSFGVTTDTIKKLTVFNGVPQTILIDREGKLRGIFLGGGARVAESRKETVEKLMNEK